MAYLVVLILALIAGISTESLWADRIVGGQPTTIDKYPSIVQVEFRGIFGGNWGQGCAADILNSRYVLSAAHCFHGFFYARANRRLRAGTTYRNIGGSLNYIIREFNHPSYGTLGYEGDITVVLLATPLVLSPVVQQGVIVSQGFVMPDNLPVIHAGWGDTTHIGWPSPVLLDVTVYTINNQLCTELYKNLEPRPGIVTENMICVGIHDVGGRGTCQGDSGGPLYFDNILIGVVSWAQGCANETYPGVSIAVASYTDWIVSIAS